MINCLGNQKQIGLALLMYSGENDGFFPPTPRGNNFEPLNTEGVLTDGKVYGCRLSETRAKTAAVSDYVYLGSGLRDDVENADSIPLATCNHGLHPIVGRPWYYLGFERTRYLFPVLYADGHVEALAEGDPRLSRLREALK